MNMFQLRRSAAAAVAAANRRVAANTVAGTSDRSAREFSSVPAAGKPDAKSTWGEVIEKMSDTFFLSDVFRATWLAWEVHMERKVTINYPFEKGMISPRFRGEHALRRYPSGEERCVSCGLSCVVLRSWWLWTVWTLKSWFLVR